MIDLELFPSEEQINMMNKEYNELKRRKGLVCNNCDTQRPNLHNSNDGNQHNHNMPCDSCDMPKHTIPSCNNNHKPPMQCNGCGNLPEPPRPEHNRKICTGAKCGTDVKQKKLFERIYFAEQDLIMALRQLYTIAPHWAKDDISDIIKLKKTNSNLALKCYYTSTDSKLSYSPNLSHEEDYCKLLRHIITLQKQLLLMLGKAKFLCAHSKKIIQNEWTVSYILTCIGMCCKF